MGYFDINIDNDITYLLSEIGHNVKVNNVPAKAIINNASLERTYDDKKIICHEELRRGYYVEYNDLFFILLNEVNDKRYNTYYKGIMRNCNYNIKLIIEDKLYLFYSIIESDKFAIDSGIISTFSNKIDITIPYTNTTSKITEGMRIIKFNKAWEVENIDYTRKGLITLMCKSVAKDSNLDDIANEIGNRYGTGGTDILKGNITPIKPFDAIEPPAPPRYNISFNVKEGDTIITDATIILKQGDTIINQVDGIYSLEQGTYTYTVENEGYISVEGVIDVVDTNIVETVNLELEPEETTELIITGATRVSVYDTPVTYTVNTDEPVVWSIVSGTTAKISSQSGNSCEIVDVSKEKFGWNTLRVELVEDNTQFAELEINIVFM